MRRFSAWVCVLAACSPTSVAPAADVTSQVDAVPGDAVADLGEGSTGLDITVAASAAADAGQGDAADAKDVSAKPACQLPATFTETQRVLTFAMTDPKDGCDLDGDGLPNNKLGKVSSLYKNFNSALAAQFADGSIVLVTTRVHEPEALDFLGGVLPAADLACHPSETACPVLAFPWSYLQTAPDVTCPARIRLLPGKSAGKWQLPAGAKVPIVLGAGHPQVFTFILRQAELTWPGPGQSARLCGAVHKAKLLQCPPGTNEKPFFDGGTECKEDDSTGMAFAPDVDTDGDGLLESVSFSIDLTTAPGTIQGFAP